MLSVCNHHAFRAEHTSVFAKQTVRQIESRAEQSERERERENIKMLKYSEIHKTKKERKKGTKQTREREREYKNAEI